MDRGHPKTGSAGRGETGNTATISDITTITEERRRIAQCECGAQLVGGSDEELFDAVERHLAHHHPTLLGALEPEVVFQMAEDVGRARSAYGRPGA